MSTSFISWLSLFDNAYMQSHAMKVSTIWFDEIVAQVPKPEMASTIVDVISSKKTITNSTADELRNIFIPIQNKLEGYQFLENNPWKHENRKLVRVAEKVTAKETIKEHPGTTEDSPGFRHEVAMAGAGLIEGIALWSMLNKMEPVGFLSHKRESEVIQRVFSESENRNPHDLFSACVEKRIPNIEELSWERVIELRNNPFMEKFRQKITEIQQGISSNCLGESLELIEEIERKDMVEFIRLAKPSSNSMSLIKFISSNMPLPIPINPVSIGLGIDEYQKGKKIVEKYGWLYFLFDLSGE